MSYLKAEEVNVHKLNTTNNQNWMYVTEKWCNITTADILRLVSSVKRALLKERSVASLVFVTKAPRTARTNVNSCSVGQLQLFTPWEYFYPPHMLYQTNTEERLTWHARWNVSWLLRIYLTGKSSCHARLRKCLLKTINLSKWQCPLR